MSKDNGGPAFPIVFPGFHYKDGSCETPQVQEGLSLRDYFAAKAMQGFVANTTVEFPANISIESGLAKIAAGAYRVADAMLLERAKP